MAMTKISWKDFDAKRLRFGDELVKNPKNNSVSVPVSYEMPDGTLMEHPRVQTPILRAPFGANRKTFNAGQPNENTNVNCNLALDDETEDEITFHGFVRELEEAVQRRAVEAVKTWWPKESRKKLDEGAVRGRFTSVIKEPTDEKYRPHVTVKLSAFPDEKQPGAPLVCATPFFDAHKQRIEDPEATVNNNARVVQILEIQPVWFMNNSFGISLRSKQCLMVEAGSTVFEELAIDIDLGDRNCSIDIGDGAGYNDDLSSQSAKRIKMTA